MWYLSSWRDLRRRSNAGHGLGNKPEITPPSHFYHRPDGTRWTSDFDTNAHHRRLFTAAAWRGLEPAPGSGLRRAFLHLSCSLCTIGQFIANLPFLRLRRTLDAPMRAHGLSAARGRERGGGDVKAPLNGAAIPQLDAGLHHGDHRQLGEAGLARKPALAGEPVDLAGDNTPAGLDATVILVDLPHRLDVLRLGSVKKSGDPILQKTVVCLDGQEVFGPAIHDGLCDIWVASDRVDAHQRPLEMAAGRQPREQRRDGGGLVRLLRASLLAEHQALVGGERRNQMQSLTPGFAVIAAPGGLAV